MGRERLIPMEYANAGLIDGWSEYNIALKVWLYPELFGDKLPGLQRRYPRPELSEIDKMFSEIMAELRKDSKPMIRY